MRYRFKHTHNRSISNYAYQHSYQREDYNVETQTWGAQAPVVGATTYESGRYVVEDTVSRIFDDFERFKTAGPRPAHPCRHTTYGLELAERLVLNYLTYAGSSTRYNHTIVTSPLSLLRNVLGLPSGTNVSDMFAGIIPRETLDAGVRDWLTLENSFDEVLHSYLRQRVNLGENIAEPDTLVSALRLCISPRATLRRLVPYVVKTYGSAVRKRSLGRVLKTLTKDLSGTYLGTVFGVKPVLKDLYASLDAHKVVAKRLAYLQSHRGKWVNLHTRFEFKSEPTPPTGPYDGPFDIIAYRKDGLGHIAASCRARIVWDQTPGKVFAAYSEYFGLNNVISLAWELIPFSFVVDWVTNAGSYIQKISRMRFGSPYGGFRDICYSQLLETVDEYYTRSGYHSLFGTDMLQCDQLMATFRHRHYERTLGLPEEFLLANLSRWKSFQTVTSGALVLQRLL